MTSRFRFREIPNKSERKIDALTFPTSFHVKRVAEQFADAAAGAIDS
jgi:hypothetical protein